MGTPLPLRAQKGAQQLPLVFAHVYCGQTGEWINMPLRTEVGLCAGHIVLDGNTVPPPKGAQQPPPTLNRGPCLLWPNGWIDLGYHLIRRWALVFVIFLLPVLTIRLVFDVKRRLLAQFPVLPKPEVVSNGQMVEDRYIYSNKVE